MGEKKEQGFTLVELMIGMLLLGVLAISIFTLFSTLIRSTVIIKRKAVASTLAITQMEYLKSLPYNNLAIAGGALQVWAGITWISSDVLTADGTGKFKLTHGWKQGSTPADTRQRDFLKDSFM